MLEKESEVDLLEDSFDEQPTQVDPKFKQGELDWTLQKRVNDFCQNEQREFSLQFLADRIPVFKSQARVHHCLEHDDLGSFGDKNRRTLVGWAAKSVAQNNAQAVNKAKADTDVLQFVLLRSKRFQIKQLN